MRNLTRPRIWLAFAVALAADVFQIALGPLGWTFLDEVADILVMITVSLLLGFHPLLLPTFIVELVPVVDMLPTWTACVAAVVMLRRRRQRPPGEPPAGGPSSRVIDI
jgi:hypothetical protein